MKINSITKAIYLSSSFIFLFCFASAWGSDINDDICSFSGSVPDPEYWNKYAFEALLLKDKEMPDYLIYGVTKIIGNIAVTDSSVLKEPSCMVSEYVKALIKYYEVNKCHIQKEHKNLANLLEFIKLKLKDKNEPAVVEGENHEEL